MRMKAKLVLGSLTLLTLLAAGASAQPLSEDKARDHRRERSKRITAAIPRIEKALRVRRDGTVELDERRPAHRRLSDGEKTLARALAHGLNGRIRAGELSISQDLKVQKLLPAESSRSELAGGFREAAVSCETHWWGEECDIDLPTTEQVYNVMETGTTLAAGCAILLPELAPACGLVELLVLAPAEEDFLTCIEQGVGSELNFTWVGTPWIDCQ